MTRLQEKVKDLLEDQKSVWPLLKTNWALLDRVRIKEFQFDGYTIQVQFNPERMRSSAANVDKVTIEKRRCFLCSANRPPEQSGIIFKDKYEILCNPFPIFSEHYTIATKEHTPQVILPELSDYLDLSRELHQLVVFYNAPACGASAPDHMHFQAGNRGLMPIEGETATLRERYGTELIHTDGLRIHAISDGLRRFFLVETSDKESLEKVVSLMIDFVAAYQGEEPMINLLCYYHAGWKLYLFPREKHRPWQYFEKGEKNILLSPAAVDMGGTLITPLEKDFNSISKKDITDIFKQVTCSEEHYQALSGIIKTKLHSHGE